MRIAHSVALRKEKLYIKPLFTLLKPNEGKMLIQVLIKLYPQLPETELQSLISNKRVTIDGIKITRGAQKVNPMQIIKINLNSKQTNSSNTASPRPSRYKLIRPYSGFIVNNLISSF